MRSVFLSPDFERVYGKYFRYIYITSDYDKGSHKKVIKFSFNLPSKEKSVHLSSWRRADFFCRQNEGAVQMDGTGASADRSRRRIRSFPGDEKGEERLGG